MQFVVGWKSCSQALNTAVQETLALIPTWISARIDVKNAFNSKSREAMAEGIAACPQDGGREVLAFFAEGVAHTVKGKAGCTQGCSLGM